MKNRGFDTFSRTYCGEKNDFTWLRDISAKLCLAVAWQNIQTFSLSPLCSYILAREESEEGCPESAAGEAVDDKVYARVQHEEKVVDAGGGYNSIHSIGFTRSGALYTR